MIYGSVCSGVEAATVVWKPLGWKPAWFCEFDKFPSAVLAHHYPDVPNLHDMTTIEERKEYHERPIQLLVGGTPCQSFSIAGLRKGLDDDRGNLALKFCQILRDKQPRWFVWENVPGVLSSNQGRDFAAILSGFSECGYGFAYRILDAQYFGVAQRRRRVFVVGYLGDWRPAAAVLFEQESLHGNPAPCREKGQRIAPSVTTGPPFSRTGNDRVEAEAIVIDRAAFNQGENALYDPMIEKTNIMPALVARGPHAISTHRMVAFGEYETDELASTIKQRDYKDATDLIAIHGTQDPDILKEKAHTLGRNNGQENSIFLKDRIRRLTPIECERLQGFPDNYTQIPWRGRVAEECPDGPRYKAMGNSMAVPVMRWIGRRIDMVDKILN
jgi:DNA (cytosine-5)-methyltransferase 1